MSPKVNRRELLGVFGAISTATAIAAASPEASAGVEVGRFTRRTGVHGKMTGPGSSRRSLLPRSELCLRNSRCAEQ